MGQTREQKAAKSAEKLRRYLKDAGGVWSTYPVCAKDICVTTVKLCDDGDILFGDTDKSGKFRVRRTISGMEYGYIDECLADMIAADAKRKK